ncbi:tetratricopeptide repeat protein [Anaerocolumna xylanovorans]|uniref:Tfp pilus assembly protein PilF n=1 Tax=Anaerocolumna xylanovorans DSM 12503 TaxID=1121345 RepID=A0A1M7YDU5_9FIRM|nr:tetratricopeptide repeat protein [Anaerocolumna xylanovorans]SHO50812.1 Tfp pilus assembly protein PilF [Anaerocolumna xylanovorans DSM 12503]
MHNKINTRWLARGIIVLTASLLLTGCGAKSAGDYYREGMEYFNSGNYEKADKSLKKAIEENGERADYYISYAMNLIQQKKYDDAIAYFERSLLDKDNAIVRKNNKQAYRGEGIAYYRLHDYKTAIEKFDKALAIKEQKDIDQDILSYKGMAQAKSGQYKEAAATYTKIIEADKGSAEAYKTRGDIYCKMGEYKKSLSDYDKAIKLEPRNYDFYFEKYFLMLNMKDEEGAKEVLSKAAAINGTTEKDKFNVAKVTYYKGDYETALQMFGEAFGNGFTESYYYLGLIYEKKKDYENAAENYSKYLESEEGRDNANACYRAAECLIKRNNYEEALGLIEDGIKINDVDVNQDLKRSQIIVYEHLTRYEEAYKLVKEYIKEYPEDEAAKKEETFLSTRAADAVTIPKAGN